MAIIEHEQVVVSNGASLMSIACSVREIWYNKSKYSFTGSWNWNVGEKLRYWIDMESRSLLRLAPPCQCGCPLVL